MTKIQRAEIDIGLDGKVHAFCLDSGIEYRKPQALDDRDVEELNAPLRLLTERYYFNEPEAISVVGVPTSLAHIFSGHLDKVQLLPHKGSYEIPLRLTKFVERAKVTVSRNGDCVSVKNVQVNEHSCRIDGQHATYSQFAATNARLDTELYPYDSSFPPGATLRDFEVEQGKMLPSSRSDLCNMSGLAFMITASGPDGADYFLMVQRRKGMKVEGGMAGFPGIVPVWTDNFFDGYMFDAFIGNQVETKLPSELCLQPGEHDIERCHIVNELRYSRLAPFLDMKTSIPIDVIAERCLDNSKVLEQHTILYAVPRTKDVDKLLTGLLRAGLNINGPTRAGMYLVERGK